jgi:hypothetical protein
VSAPGERPGSARIGAAAVAVAVVLQSLWLAHLYPAAYLDADLLSYLAYYRDLRAGEPVPFGYTVPKALPILLFGPLADPGLVLWASIAIAALGGGLLYAIARRAFGPAVALVAAVLYLLDPMRGVLTLRSSVDLAVGVALLGAVFALQRRAVVWAGVAMLVAALGKPPAIACAVALALVPGVPWRRRLLAMLLPALALPATAALDAALEGRSLVAGIAALTLPDQHERFVRVAQARVLGLGETIRLIGGEWFGGTLFARTWPLVLLGVALCLARPLADALARAGAAGAASRLRRWAPSAEPGAGAAGDPRGFAAPILLVPLLLALAYLAIALVHPMIVFTRFFWPLAVALALLAALAVVWVVTRLPVATPVRVALAAALVAALLADRLDDQRWRASIMLRPFEDHAALADEAVRRIARADTCDGSVLVPLAYLPLAAWHAPGKLRRGELCAVEDWAEGRGCATPSCVLFIPAAPTTEHAREAMGRLVHGGFVVEVGDDSGALVRSIRG